MKIDILYDVPVSGNLSAGDAGEACAYNFAWLLDNGDVVSMYRRGADKHSYDGTLVMQVSGDDGETWGDPLTVFDGRDMDPPLCVVTGAFCQTSTGALLATVGAVEVTRPDVYMFSEEGNKQRRVVLAVRSDDLGRTWSAPAVVDTSAFVSTGITTKPVPLHGGEVFVPLEITTGEGVNGTGATFSPDDGRSFGPCVVCAADPEGKLNWCDARLATLPDGQRLMLLWTFRQDDEETLSPRICRSADDGRTWTRPEPTGIAGQIASPVALPSGAVLAATNVRHPPEGIRLWGSADGGCAWNTDEPLMMWSARQSKMLGEPVSPEPEETRDEGVWAALDAFTFGTPDMVLLRDGSVLLTYYAYLGEVCHVRACRFRLLDI